ncbi:MAG TPA: alpha/beta hydrolase [Actinomycetes bacterium]
MASSIEGRRRLSAVPAEGPPGVHLRFHTIHGYRRAYRVAGHGPAVLLLHGIGDSSLAWADLIPRLAQDHLVIAPDLLGHGASDKPRADYSVAAYANGMRDLLGVLDVERVTVVGHSFGGGVAMQFAYQFPERTERLVLVSAGGVARQVNPLLRGLSLPGAELALNLLRLPTVRWQLRTGTRVLGRVDAALGDDARECLRIAESFPDQQALAAFGRTLKSVVDWRGQVVTMLDRCYLAAGMPTLLVWGSHDTIVPLSHAHVAHEAMPGSHLHVFDGAGHFPHHSDPERFARVLRHFLRTTQPADWSPQQWRALVRGGGRGGETGNADLQMAHDRDAT